MEPLIALSLAGNILQFIHTTRQLISTTRDIVDKGRKKEHLELELIARDLQERADRITVPVPASSATGEDGNDQSLLHLGTQCKSIATELLAVLEKLKLRKGGNRWDSFLQVLKTEWKSSEIDALRQRLERIAEAVNARFTESQQRKVLVRLDELHVENLRLEMSRASDIVDLKTKFDRLFDGINKRGKNDSDGGRLAQIMYEASSTGLQYCAEQVILETIRFDRLEDRYANISAAHRSTLKWLFGDPEGGQRQLSSATFVQWLESDDDLYWVSGRPGSGKSTLMKFLYTEPRTQAYLKTWANGDQVISAEYFFWNAGKNVLQKSQEGLLRSIVYQILRKRPDLIQTLFPELWRLCNSPKDWESREPVLRAKAALLLDLSGLLGTLSRTCQLLTHSKTRFCFFLDGLDEYEGNSGDVIKLIGELRNLPSVKICVSSRPWNEFEEAYGKRSTAKLYMQDFNGQDISGYIYDVFSNDEYYQELEDKDTQGRALVEEIVDAAKGVFLWVVLVVRSFQEGLRNGDSIQLLKERLRTLPRDLNGYFERILFHDVDDFYRREAARMFFVTLEAKENLPLLAYWYLGEAIPAERRPMTMQQTNKRVKDIKRRLIASCKGLLEPHYQSPDILEDPLPSAILFNEKVDFLHRTVRDYLELPGTEILIRRWIPRDFDPHEAICKALFCQVKTSPCEPEYFGPISRLQSIFLYHTSKSPKRSAELENLEPQMRGMVDSYERRKKETTGQTSGLDADSQLTTAGRSRDAQTTLAIPSFVPKPEDTSPSDTGPPKGRSLSLFKRLASKLGRKKG